MFLVTRLITMGQSPSSVAFRRRLPLARRAYTTRHTLHTTGHLLVYFFPIPFIIVALLLSLPPTVVVETQIRIHIRPAVGSSPLSPPQYQEKGSALHHNGTRLAGTTGVIRQQHYTTAVPYHTDEKIPHHGDKIPHPGDKIPHPGDKIPHPGDKIPHPAGNRTHPGDEIPHPGDIIPHPLG